MELWSGLLLRGIVLWIEKVQSHCEEFGSFAIGLFLDF